MKMIKCSGMDGDCQEVNYLRRIKPGVHVLAQFVEDGWQQVSADEFLCADCIAVTLREHHQQGREMR